MDISACRGRPGPVLTWALSLLSSPPPPPCFPAMLQTVSSSSRLELDVSLLLLLLLLLFSSPSSSSPAGYLKLNGKDGLCTPESAVVIGFIDTAASAGETADDPVAGAVCIY